MQDLYDDTGLRQNTKLLGIESLNKQDEDKKASVGGLEKMMHHLTVRSARFL